MKDCPYAEYACAFKALSDQTRVKLCALISDQETCGCELLSEVDVTQPTLSYHMKQLCDVGLVNSRKDGVWTRYSINQEKITELQEFLNSLKTNEL